MSHILLVDDDTSITLSLAMLMRRCGYTTARASNEEEALAEVRRSMREKPGIDLIIMDMNYTSSTTGRDGLELLTKIKVLIPDVPVILMTAWGSIPLAVEGMRNGAMDFITKPWDNRDLMSRVNTALSLHSADAGNDMDTAPLDGDNYGIIGRSEAITGVLEKIRRVAPTDAAILITGENGTGKELVARAIHTESMRRDHPFVAVNLGGLPRSLFESEMFGHAKGAYTGAERERSGRFEAADGGTIFLDEIGDLDLSCQVKMLRVLQEQTFERLGETTPRKVNLRVICATNVDLVKAVRENRFREDLYYRINIISIHLPALRERREDIPLLVEKFAGGKAEFTPDAMALLQSLPYPGNVRQLQNLVNRLVIVNDSKVITSAMVREAVKTESTAISEENVSSASSGEVLTLEQMERRAITDALERFKGNLSQVAASLGISRQSLYRRMEKLDIHQS
ncbi:MAG: sigma-54-dependent Fis family transcriptional regulator [Muribaculaceae bacterium]|nr:sigma-54-dependent Fis family transcriptional regulator [Muribaculaceae bacterium]